MEKLRILSEGELIVMLAVQRRPRDAYGVSIRDEIEDRTGRRMTFGVVYTYLARLERDGLLRSREAESTPERGGRAKTYFTLTGSGERAIRHSLHAIDQMRGGLATTFWAKLRQLAQALGFLVVGTSVAFAGDVEPIIPHIEIWFSVTIVIAIVFVSWCVLDCIKKVKSKAERLAQLSPPVRIVHHYVSSENLVHLFGRAAEWRIRTDEAPKQAKPHSWLFYTYSSRALIRRGEVPKRAPRSLDMLFWLALPSKNREAQLGDMAEDYQRTLSRYDRKWIADLDYLKQGISFVLQSYRQGIERLIHAWLKGA